VHLVCFSLFLVFLNRQQAYVVEVDSTQVRPKGL
jgi:hypothetical protein